VCDRVRGFGPARRVLSFSVIIGQNWFEPRETDAERKTKANSKRKKMEGEGSKFRANLDYSLSLFEFISTKNY